MGDSVWDERAPHRTPRPPTPSTRPVTGSVRVIQVTDDSDGPLVNRGYSYWSQAWVNGNTAYVFAGHEDGNLRFYEVDLATGVITRLGNLLGGSE